MNYTLRLDLEMMPGYFGGKGIRKYCLSYRQRDCTENVAQIKYSAS